MILIRPFRPTDLPSLIHIAELSFAEEYIARGETPNSFARQIRMATRGRMIPFKILTAVAGYRWELFVADVGGTVVGCGSYLGREQMELANLMVHPQYRRQGIGRALLQKRLERLTELGYPFVTTTILANNIASLNNVAKQGFTVYDQYSILEASIPLPPGNTLANTDSLSRLLHPDDKEILQQAEMQVATPLWLQIEKSSSPNYFLSPGDRLLNRLTHTQVWTRTCIVDGKPVGFLLAITSDSQTKGTIARPLFTDEHLIYLPTMLNEAVDWLAQLGKTAVQIAISDTRHTLETELQAQGWVKTQSWVRLVKWLT